MAKNKSPHDIVHRLFPETKLNISNVEQRSIHTKRNIQAYTQGPRLGIINRGMVHEHILARQLNGKVIPYTVQEMRKCDRLIYIGPFISRHLRRLWQVCKVSPGIKIYLWWIGTDVYNAMNRLHRFRLRDISRLRNVTHLAVSDNLKEELKTIGITAEVLTLVPDISNLNPMPLPKKYTVAVYMPSSHLQFYRYGDMKKIVKALPDINFIFYGNRDKLDVESFSNVKVRGWVRDTRVIFRDCNALARLTIHDGFPKSVIEAVLLNRSVVTNQKFPRMGTFKNVGDVIGQLKARPRLSKGVREYYATNYSMKKTIEYFNAGR